MTMAKPEKNTLPSDKYESQPAAQVAAEVPTVSPALLEQIDIGVKHLLVDPTNWRMPVPTALDPWQPLQFAILDGGSDENVQKARDSLGGVYFRIYTGFVSRELLLIVRVPDTAYLRAEVLPWTIGK